MYITYVLQSLKDHTFYIGYTSNLERRLHFHNSGISFYSRRKMPWNVVFTKKFASRSNAIKYEKYLKSLKGGVKFYQETNIQRGSRSAG